jgi:hypothetical protein
MKVPAVFRALYEGPGGILVSGMGVLALVLSAVALGPIGCMVTVVIILVLGFVELWRATVLTEQELAKSKNESLEGRQDSEKARHLEREVERLNSELHNLAAKAASPEASYEALLSAINVHLSVLSTVEKHRAVRDSAPDPRVTSAQMSEGGEVQVTADCSCDPNIFAGESVVLVPAGTSEQVSEIAAPNEISEYEISVPFQSENIPPPLLQELQQQGSIVPNGYSIRLAGLVETFEYIADDDLAALIAALKEARVKIHAAIDDEVPISPSLVDIESEEAVAID